MDISLFLMNLLAQMRDPMTSKVAKTASLWVDRSISKSDRVGSDSSYPVHLKQLLSRIGSKAIGSQLLCCTKSSWLNQRSICLAIQIAEAARSQKLFCANLVWLLISEAAEQQKITVMGESSHPESEQHKQCSRQWPLWQRFFPWANVAEFRVGEWSKCVGTQA